MKKKNLMKELSRLGKYRYQLAPLWYGAGVKGKIFDGWMHQTPPITTPIGAEGMFLEQIDNCYDHQRVLNNTEGYFKSEKLFLKETNQDLENYYSYRFDQEFERSSE